jgi:hypothetical protein
VKPLFEVFGQEEARPCKDKATDLRVGPDNQVLVEGPNQVLVIRRRFTKPCWRNIVCLTARENAAFALKKNSQPKQLRLGVIKPRLGNGEVSLEKQKRPANMLALAIKLG